MGKKMCSVSRNISTGCDISISVLKFGIWIQYLDTSKYIVSCDIAWYGIWYHAISHRITSQHQVNTNSTKTHHLVAVYSFFSALSLPSSWLVLDLAFLVVFLLSISWTHHRTDRTTSKQQPCPFKTRPAPWAHVCFVSFFFFFFCFFSFFPSLFFLIPGSWYSSFFLLYTSPSPRD